MISSQRCPDCNAELPSGAAHCEPCRRKLETASDSGASKKLRNPWAFSLAELMIATTFVCIVLGVTMASPEWGIVLWALSAFALARTIWFSAVWKRAGRPFSSLGQIGSFVESLVVMSLVAAAAAVAFLGVCFPLGMTVVNCCSPNHSETLAICAWVFGGAAGLASGGFLLWWLCIAPVVAWWRTGRPPTIVMRIAALGWPLVQLSSTFLGSMSLAVAAGWIWLRSVDGPNRSDRQFRITLYGMLLAGYVLGMILGVTVGRLATYAGRRWFRLILTTAAMMLVFLPVLMALGMSENGDPLEPIIAIAAACILAVLIVGLIIHRFFYFRGESDASSPDDSTKRKV